MRNTTPQAGVCEYTGTLDEPVFRGVVALLERFIFYLGITREEAVVMYRIDTSANMTNIAEASQRSIRASHSSGNKNYEGGYCSGCGTSVRSGVSMRISVKSESRFAAQR